MEGLPNFCKVSDDLFRCAQPTLNGMRNLKEIGIRTVVNLCAFHSDREMLKNTGIDYKNIHMIAWPLIPEEKQVVKFLSIVTDPKKTRFSFIVSMEQIAQGPCAQFTALSCRDGRKRMP